MRNRINAVLVLILLSLMTVLAVTAFKVWEKKADDILLMVPSRPVTEHADIEKLEDENEVEYLMTYETSRAGKLSVVNDSIDVVIKGTNYLYANVMQAPVLSGSFFTKAAQEEKRKLAVLNETAAFEILGGMDAAGREVKIENFTFTVCGVIQDGDKDVNNVYVPLLEELGFSPPDAFAAALDGNTETAREEVINKMKNFSIGDSFYDFFSLGDFTGAVNTKMMFSIKLSAIVVLSFFFLWGFSWVRRKHKQIQALNEQYDPGDVFRKGWLIIAGTAFGGLGLAASVVLMMLMLLSGIEDILFIADIDITMASNFSPGFEFVISGINKLSMYSHFTFLGFIVVLFIIFISNIISLIVGRRRP